MNFFLYRMLKNIFIGCFCVLFSVASSFANTPFPKDIPISLPGPFWLFVSLLLIFFGAHIVFVNFMVGSSLIVALYEIMGLKNKKFLSLARVLSVTITANKSLAVVLGVGPLLCINTIYTVYFYTANAITGYAWISVVPLVATSFLLIYLHKYTWDRWSVGWLKLLHILLILLVNLIFLFVPLIFLANINLMLFPHKWIEIVGFLGALSFPNVWFRYLHFICACLALTGLFMVYYGLWFYDKIKALGVDVSEFIALGYKWLLCLTLFQFAVGPLVLLTLPSQGINVLSLVLPLFGAILAILMLLFVAHTLRSDGAVLSRGRFGVVCLIIFAILALMIVGRHEYRETSVGEHRSKMHFITQSYLKKIQLHAISSIDEKSEDAIKNGGCITCLDITLPCPFVCLTIPNYSQMSPQKRLFERCVIYKRLQPSVIQLDCNDLFPLGSN